MKPKNPNRLLRWRIISDERKGPYLRRFVLWECKWFGIYIHHIIGDDPDEHHFHDHPWSFMTVPLWGEYWDETPYDPLWSRLGPVYTLVGWMCPEFRRAEHVHRVSLRRGGKSGLRPAITLILRGPKRRSWYFHPIEGGAAIPWRRHLNLDMEGEGHATSTRAPAPTLVADTPGAASSTVTSEATE